MSSGEGSPLPRRFGLYLLLADLGRGGSNQVYRAEVAGEKRSVVVKFLPAAKRTEIEAIARLRHPNIAPVEHAGDIDGQVYLVREYLEGGTLEERLRGSPMHPQEAARLLAALARAVHHAHEQYILHCDLTPSNVLFARDGTPKLTDFGLAGQPQGRQISGTPGYLAPEQTTDDTGQIAPRTDVYGLGALLYAALTGRPPFCAADPRVTLDLVRNAAPLPPSRLHPTVPQALETICLCCLQKQPAWRYASARALVVDLERFLQGRPLMVRPPGLVERGWHWCRRHALAAGLAGAVVAAVLTGIIVLAFLWHQAVRQRDQALAAVAQTRETAEQIEQQRARAETSYRLAREALERCMALQNDPRLQQGPLENLKRTLQQVQAAFLEKLVQMPDDDEGHRRERAQALFQLGLLTDHLGGKDARNQAIGHLENARAALAELGKHHPHQPAYAMEEARVQGALGLLYTQMGQPARAVAAYEEAAALLNKPIEAAPAALDLLLLQAQLSVNLAKLREQTGNVQAALAGYGRARALYERLHQAQPRRADVQLGLAAVLEELGVLYQNCRQPVEARRCYEQACPLLEELARAQPHDPRFALWLGSLYAKLAGAQGQAWDGEAALAWYARAIAALEGVRPKLPKPNPADEPLKWVYRGRAEALTRLDRPGPAVADWDKALALCTQAGEQQEIRCERAAARARAGDRVKAAAEATQLAGERELSPAALYRLARVFALLARGEQSATADSLGARAVRLLAFAEEAGLPAVELAYRDRDFSAIHAREDFQTLLHPGKS
jgi:tetratricopeptide (TPR) repeat protein